MGVAGSCCSCEDEAGNFVDEGKRPRRENRKRHPDEFTIIVDRRNGEGLGIDASPEKTGALVIRSITAGGLVDRWNQALAHDSRETVKLGMRIVEVNGRYN